MLAINEHLAKSTFQALFVLYTHSVRPQVNQ